MCAGCQKPGISRGIWFFMSKLYILLCHFNATKAHRMLKRDGERGKGRVKERTSAATCKLNSHPTWPLHPQGCFILCQAINQQQFGARTTGIQ